MAHSVLVLTKYKVDPLVLSAEQIPLHRNESSTQKTLNFRGKEQYCFVKENHNLSRERCTVMTVVSSKKELKPPPLEFVFKGKGQRVTLNPSNKVKSQWTEKEFYRIKQMLEYINRLPTIPAAFYPERHVIFTLRDCSVHLPPEIETASFKKGYFLIHIRGGITGDVQVNDTIYHKQSKVLYGKKEMELMLNQLKKNPGKIPQPSRDEMMDIFNNAWQEEYNRIDNVDAYKKNMISIALDGSEDHLASKKLMDLVGEEMLAFREELLKSEPVSSLKDLMKQITPPEGMHRSTKSSNTDDPLPDEGYKLYDGDGEELEEESDEVLEEEQEDTVEDDSAKEPTEDHENPSDIFTPQVADVLNVPDHIDVKLVKEIL